MANVLKTYPHKVDSQMMKAEIIAAGSELVSGEKLDTNSRWISRKLENLGINVRFHTTIGDDLDENVAAFRIAAERADLVLVGGGLGPTQDDLTREALAQTANVPLIENPESLRDRGLVRPSESCDAGAQSGSGPLAARSGHADQPRRHRSRHLVPIRQNDLRLPAGSSL